MLLQLPLQGQALSQQEACKSGALDLPSDLAAPDFIKAPPTPQQRSAYRANIGGKWRWAEALPELQYYYETYGFGITAASSTLKWAGGFLEVHTPPTGECLYPVLLCVDSGHGLCHDMCKTLHSMQSTWCPVKQCFVVYAVAHTSGSVALTQNEEGGHFHDPHQA